MSFELTFRQRAIRISAAAAIAGLSFSFIVGETVDTHAQRLREWSPDPALVPASYLPLRPLDAALERLENSAWSESLVAMNSLPNLPVAREEIASNLAAAPAVTSAESAELVSAAQAAPEPHYYREPRIVSVSASPAPAPVAAEAEEKPVAKAAVKAAVKPEPELAPSDVEELLVSIHQATRKLTAPAKLARTDVTQSTTLKVVAAPPRKVAPPPPSPKPQPAVTVASLEDSLVAPSPLAALSRGARCPEKAWSIQGRIWGATPRSLEAGHFEVGLYSKIDPDGNPVGYPMPQQILPTGQTSFKLDVPAKLERGYLFAEFVATKGGKRTQAVTASNPWERCHPRLAQLYFRADDAISSVAAAPASLRDVARDRWQLRGSVTTLFTGGQGAIPQSDVTVKVRGRREAARTDSKGHFVLELPRLKGTLFLEVLKGGYHPSIVSVPAGSDESVRIEIASRHAIDQISQRLGASQGVTSGLFLGQVLGTDGNGLRGATAQLGLKADGPFYFDEEGNATREAKATTANGRFLFLNVEAGTGFLDVSVNGEAVAPVQVSSVEGGELLQKALMPVSGSLKGRIFNPVAQGGKMQPLGGARVRVDGAAEWVTSDSFGAFSIGPLKWMRGERISLEVTAERFNNHRYLVTAPEAGAAPLNLYAFPASYIGHLARSMDVDLDPYAGVVIGKVEGPSLRVDALAEHSLVNTAKDFYFDAHGRLRGSHEMTDPRFGTYIIFNVPKGRVLLQGNDGAGTLRYSGAVFANPASINVEL